MRWNNIDADIPNQAIESLINQYIKLVMIAKGFDENQHEELNKFARAELKKYKNGQASYLNRTIGVEYFQPHEFAHITEYDHILDNFAQWIMLKEIEWREGSHSLQVLIREFDSAGSVRIPGGREYVELDNLIMIDDKRIAIEIETSINMDNGYFSLRQAIREKKAEFGIMIVPWTEEGPGRANEGKALGRLDREFNNSDNIKDGPIYRLGILRMLDIFRRMLIKKQKNLKVVNNA